MGKKIHLNFQDLKRTITYTFESARRNKISFYKLIQEIKEKVYQTSGYGRLTRWERGYLSCMIETNYDKNHELTIWAHQLDGVWYVSRPEKRQLKNPKVLSLEESGISWERVNNEAKSASIWIDLNYQGEVAIYSGTGMEENHELF